MPKYKVDIYRHVYILLHTVDIYGLKKALIHLKRLEIPFKIIKIGGNMMKELAQVLLIQKQKQLLHQRLIGDRGG